MYPSYCESTVPQQKINARFRGTEGCGKDMGTRCRTNHIRRIRSIQAVERFEDLRKLPQLAFHALTGNRSGEFAITIIGKIRLVLKKEMVEGIEVAIVWEVSDHYE